MDLPTLRFLPTDLKEEGTRIEAFTPRGERCGYVYYRMSGETILFGYIRTLEKHAGKGVCAALLNHFIKQFENGTPIEGNMIEDKTIKQIKELGLNAPNLRDVEQRFTSRSDISQFYMANKFTRCGIVVSELTIRASKDKWTNPDVEFKGQIQKK